MIKTGQIHIGTSGWHYKHWKGTFYPADIKEKDQLAEYLKTFSTVELNNSFYRLPEPETFSHWAAAAPNGFIFAVKASRYITHMKKLKDTTEAVETMLRHADKLKEKLGPVIFQLPPGWKVNTERFAYFLSHLPKGYLYVFEFRNPTWYCEEIYELLHNYKCAFCIYELDHHLTPLQVTADFVYIRLHGPDAKYQGSYSQAQLTHWATLCRQWMKEGKDVFIYFDNDQNGYAAFNAKALAKIFDE